MQQPDMPEASARLPQTEPAFDMKAGQFTIPTLVLRDRDTDALDRFLIAQTARAPRFFDRAPIAIDVSQLAGDDVIDLLIQVVGMLRGHAMIPVGVRGAAPTQHEQIAALELALMPAPRQTAAPAAPAKAHDTGRTLVVEQPVRSGQRIFARGGDLVLLGGVSSGAEVMAEGHIHAYGPLRGRAMAGVSGNVAARVFCRELGAELISIAGRYRVSENLESRYLGKAVSVSLNGDKLEFRLL
jgi:septum site-determining protein MinC